MLELKADSSRAEGSQSGKGITRRGFLRGLSLISLLSLAGPGLMQACKLPVDNATTAPAASPLDKTASTPGTTGQATLTEALKNRKSAGSFQTNPIPREMLLELLWAAWGINRPDSGKRTAPSAMNAQEIDVYVLLPDGAYKYDAGANQLQSVLAGDIRSKATTRGILLAAHAQLIYVADYSKLRVGSQAEREQWSACHTGFIGQNVYLYCAANGLGARFYAGVNRDALRDPLQLRKDQGIVFAQAVGYSA
jgi:nitroreductase